MLFATILLIVPTYLAFLLIQTIRSQRAAKWVVFMDITRRRNPTLYWAHVVCLAGAFAATTYISVTLWGAAIQTWLAPR